MKKTRHTPEQIIRMLRQAEAKLAAGSTVPQVAKELGISEATFHRWKTRSGGMNPQEAKRLKELATPGEFAEAARSLGFTDVTVEDATADVWPSLLRMYRLGWAGYPVASFLKALRLCDDGRLASARSCLKQYRALRHNLWLYGIFTARVEVE